MTTISNSPTFFPTQISGCSLWLDAADSATISVNGSNVIQWTDKSGNSNNASQAVASNQPFFVNNSIIFNGSQNLDLVNPNALASNTPFSVFFIEQRATFSNYNYILAGSPNTTNQNLHIGYNTNTVFRLGFYNNDLSYTVPSYSAGNEPFRLWSATQSSTGRSIHLNGILSASDLNTTLLTSWNGGNIGKNLFGGTNYYYGTIKEIIFFKPSLGTSQRQQVEGYLAWKWGLQANLPTSHPFYTNPIIPNFNLSIQLQSPFTNINNTSYFTPTTIQGCALWLDAADANTVITNGSNVTQWRDKSGSNNSSTSAGGTITYNNNLIKFDGSVNTSYFELPTITISTSNMSVFAYIKFTSTYTYPNDGNFYFVDFLRSLTTPVLNLAFTRTNSAPYFWLLNYYTGGGATNGQGLLTTGAGGPSGTRYLFSILNTQNIYTQFSSGSNINTQNTIGFTPNTSQLYRVGTGANGIEIGEIIMFPTSALTTSQRQQVEGYLAWKWGLQSNLPTTHPFYNNPFIPNARFLPQTLNLQLNSLVQFNPLSFSGLDLWLDAADTRTISLSNDILTQWNDKSGNNRNPTLVNTILYSNSNVFTSNSYLLVPLDIRKTTISELNIFLVYNHVNNTSPTTQGLWGNDVGGGWNRFQLLNWIDGIRYIISGGVSNATIIRPIVNNLSNLNRLLYHSSQSLSNIDNSFVYLNGSNNLTYTEFAGSNPTTTTNTYFGSIDGTRPGNINFNEIIVYRRSIRPLRILNERPF